MTAGNWQLDHIMRSNSKFKIQILASETRYRVKLTAGTHHFTFGAFILFTCQIMSGIYPVYHFFTVIVLPTKQSHPADHFSLACRASLHIQPSKFFIIFFLLLTPESRSSGNIIVDDCNSGPITRKKA